MAAILPTTTDTFVPSSSGSDDAQRLLSRLGKIVSGPGQDGTVMWIGAGVHDFAVREAYQELATLATWSGWLRFDEAIPQAPREPGVYLFRDPATEQIVYAGMAGERAGGGRPQGLYGRLSVYRTGKGAVSGFGEAALDRALADPQWVEQQLDRLRSQGPRRAKLWAADAIARIAPEVSWAVRLERIDAKLLEDQVVMLLRPHGLWNR